MSKLLCNKEWHKTRKEEKKNKTRMPVCTVKEVEFSRRPQQCEFSEQFGVQRLPV